MIIAKEFSDRTIQIRCVKGAVKILTAKQPFTSLVPGSVCYRMSPSGRFVCFGNYSENCYIWDSETQKHTLIHSGATSYRCTDVSDTGMVAIGYVSHKTGVIGIYREGKHIFKLSTGDDWPSYIRLSPCDTFVSVTTESNRAFLWEVQTGREMKTSLEKGRIGFAPDSTLLLSSGMPSSVLNIDQKTKVTKEGDLEFLGEILAFSEDNRYVIAFRFPSNVLVYERNGVCVWKFCHYLVKGACWKGRQIVFIDYADAVYTVEIPLLTLETILCSLAGTTPLSDPRVWEKIRKMIF